ncbi:hypothetical protein JIG36_32480 [Actinoplanes sp. LDG1-06]|uniref:Uncharacterized protein n=1 Tax=Paractinoplanes ovalisporus TaxID=2810368 RepID=A0ABS2ALK0_9ACTN|nr:hypothetical protein [Actinoplanes ovalisporus]MBM2620243.1 hypothetical protein [Actinoplanes ovalisporus]
MEKQRFLVLHDYGMGGLWWWVHARSAREVVETFAEAEVVDDPETIARFADDDDLDEVDVDDAVMPPGLDDMRARRDEQRGRPGFGALADREIVHLRRAWDEDDPAVYLMEVGRDGRRLRQVELRETGPGVRGVPDDWAFNPPVVDIFDPVLVEQQIDQAEFERAWESAVPDDSTVDGSAFDGDQELEDRL